MYPATNATPPNSKTVPANAAGSVGSVLNSSAAIHFAATTDVMAPTAIPTSTSRIVLAITPSCTRSVVAPNAMRMPISCVCRVTEYEITP
jgi:hypothetical protein